MRTLLAIALSMLLSACATVGTEQVAKLDRKTRIAPLSLMGTSLSVRAIGTTVFQNSKADAEVSDWQIDNYTESVVAEHLVKSKRVIAVHSNVWQFHSIKPIVDSIAAGTSFEGGTLSIIAYAKEANADVVLVILPALYGDPYFGTNQAFTGYGVYERGFLGSKSAVNYVTMRVAAFDGTTGKEIARTSGYISAKRPESEWMEFDNLVMNEHNRLVTQQSIKQLIRDLLARLLSDLKIGPA